MISGSITSPYPMTRIFDWVALSTEKDKLDRFREIMDSKLDFVVSLIQNKMEKKYYYNWKWKEFDQRRLMICGAF